MNQKMREYYSRLSERYYLWNARKALAASGTIWNHLERPLAKWNARRALGTREALWNRAAGSTWNARKALGTREALHRLHGASVRLSEV